MVVVTGPINVIRPVKANTVGPVSDVMLVNAVRPIMASVFGFVEAFKIQSLIVNCLFVINDLKTTLPLSFHKNPLLGC